MGGRFGGLAGWLEFTGDFLLVQVSPSPSVFLSCLKSSGVARGVVGLLVC